MVVYIAEAHAQDEWPVGRMVSCCARPQSLSERVRLLQRLGSGKGQGHGGIGAGVGACLRRWPPGSVLVDTMDDGFATQYAAWPTRFYVLAGERGDERVAFKAQPHESDCGYHLGDLADYLDAHCA